MATNPQFPMYPVYIIVKMAFSLQTVVLYTKFVHKSVQLSPESSVFAVALFVRMMYNTKYQAKRGDPVGEKK